MSTPVKRNYGKPKAAGRESSNYVFQSDNKESKDNGNVNGNVSAKGNSSNSSKKIINTNNQVKTPRVVNGKCVCCPFDGDIINETIDCSKCLQTYHATCRDKRGIITDNSICSKTFLPKFRALSAHYGGDKSRWGNFVFICGLCDTGIEVDNNIPLCDNIASSFCEVSVQNSPLLLSKETQSQTQTFVSSGSQTLTSGNILESSFDSVKSYLDICNVDTDSKEGHLLNLDEPEPEPNVNLNINNSECNETNQIYQGSNIVNEMRKLTQLNNEVLENIKSLKELSLEHASNFVNQLSNLKSEIKTKNFAPSHTSNPQNHNTSSDNLLNVDYDFNPIQYKPYKDLKENVLENELAIKVYS